MHLALQIPDILVLIFEEAEVPTLIAAACCCRALSEAALDVLWRSTGGFTSLLKILPAFQMHQSYIKPYRYWQILQGEISDEAWDRLTAYARRVRTFYNGYPGEVVETIHPSVYLHLARRFEFVFPHLSYFNLNLEYLDDATGISTLICLPPSLRRLDLSYHSAELFSDGGYIVGAMFDQIPTTAPDIADLRVALYIPDNYIDKIVLMRQLHTLRLSEMIITTGCSWLHRLPALTNLTDLTLSVITIAAPDSSAPLDWSNLTSLRSLTMDGLLKNFAYVLGALPANQLHTLKLVMEGRRTLAKDSWPRELWQELYTCLSLISRHSSLYEIKLDLQTFEFHDYVTYDGMAFSPFLSKIKPLLSLRSLKCAIFRAFPPVDLSHNDLTICGHAWPDIETLEFPFTLHTMLSLDAVHSLLSSCPKLDHLGVALERLDPPINSEQLPWSTILTTLRIHVLIAIDPPLATTYLLRLFPELRHVLSFTYDRDSVCASLCDNMWRALRIFRGEIPESPFLSPERFRLLTM